MLCEFLERRAGLGIYKDSTLNINEKVSKISKYWGSRKKNSSREGGNLKQPQLGKCVINDV